MHYKPINAHYKHMAMNLPGNKCVIPSSLSLSFSTSAKPTISSSGHWLFLMSASMTVGCANHSGNTRWTCRSENQCNTLCFFFNSYSASHDNWCTGTLLNRIMTSQWEGMGDVASARYEPALLPPCPAIRVISYSKLSEIHPLHF